MVTIKDVIKQLQDAAAQYGEDQELSVYDERFGRLLKVYEAVPVAHWPIVSNGVVLRVEG